MKDETPVCANCGILIRWLPTVVDGKTYCCLGCAQGGPCDCDYHHLPYDTDRAHMVVQRRGVIEKRAEGKAHVAK